jgi:hypothetical protein
VTRIVEDRIDDLRSNSLSLAGIKVAQAIFGENSDLKSVRDWTPTMVPIQPFGDSTHHGLLGRHQMPAGAPGKVLLAFGLARSEQSEQGYGRSRFSRASEDCETQTNEYGRPLDDCPVCNAEKLIHFTAVKMSHSGLVLSSLFFEILNV